MLVFSAQKSLFPKFTKVGDIAYVGYLDLYDRVIFDSERDALSEEYRRKYPIYIFYIDKQKDYLLFYIVNE